MSPDPAASGINGGNIHFICIHAYSKSPVTVTFKLRGRPGVRGGIGGDGNKGEDGTHATRGDCKFKLRGFKSRCHLTRGHPGRRSTEGRYGARGGRGGRGGSGGNLSFYYRSLSPGLKFVPDLTGGSGGPGGTGRAPGPNGVYIPFDKFIIGCRWFCKDWYATIRRLGFRRTYQGPTGYQGYEGPTGYADIKKDLSAPRTNLSIDDRLRFSALAERYYNDLALSGDIALCDEATSVMASINALSARHQDIELMKSMGRRAKMMMKALQLRKGLFGPALLSRDAPFTIKEDLSRALRYSEALRTQISNIRSRGDILTILTETAAISLPGTNFNALRRDLRVQRDTFRRGVLDVERRLELAVIGITQSVEAYIAEKKKEAERKRKRASFKSISNIVSIASGLLTLDVNRLLTSGAYLVNTIGDVKISISHLKETFKNVKETFKTVGNITKELKHDFADELKIPGQIKQVRSAFSKASGCDLQDLKALLVDAPDRLDKSPNLVDLDMDFSKIQDIGVIGELTTAQLATRASKLTVQFACLFGETLDDIPNLKSVFENYFILAGSRLGILGRMVDIDIELQRVNIIAEGVQAQKNQLARLRRDINVSSRSAALVVLSISFEQARMSVVEITERLAHSYSNLVLRPMDEDVQRYARRRLGSNGASGVSSLAQYTNLVRLENQVKTRFRSAHGCTTRREIPSSGFYSFDLKEANSPELFSNPLKTGRNGRTTLVLDIQQNCAFYAHTRPATRGMAVANVRPFCIPNKVKFNARMVSMAVELLGGDESLLPQSRTRVFSSLEQVGSQTFHAKPNLFTSFEVEPLQFSIGSIHLTGGVPSDISYHPTCENQDGGLTRVNLDSPRVCPSPLSTYALQIGLVEEVGLHPYLETIKTIRIHTKLVSYTRASTATQCIEV